MRISTIKVARAYSGAEKPFQPHSCGMRRTLGASFESRHILALDSPHVAMELLGYIIPCSAGMLDRLEKNAGSPLPSRGYEAK